MKPKQVKTVISSYVELAASELKKNGSFNNPKASRPLLADVPRATNNGKNAEPIIRKPSSGPKTVQKRQLSGATLGRQPG